MLVTCPEQPLEQQRLRSNHETLLLAGRLLAVTAYRVPRSRPPRNAGQDQHHSPHPVDDGTDFYTLNPKGYVPLLELDNGERLSEGPAIVQYLADQNPASGLAPAAGTLARYRLQEWLNFITSEIHKQFGPMFVQNTPAEYKEILKDKLGKPIASGEPGQGLPDGQAVHRGRRLSVRVLRWSVCRHRSSKWRCSRRTKPRGGAPKVRRRLPPKAWSERRQGA